MTQFIAQFAASEYRRRRKALDQALTSGQIDADTADANASLWLAIAAAAGADLPELEIVRIFPPGTRGKRMACEIALTADWQAELTRARDIAVRRALSDLTDLKAQQRAWDMQALAVNLGCVEATMIAGDESEAA